MLCAKKAPHWIAVSNGGICSKKKRHYHSAVIYPISAPVANAGDRSFCYIGPPRVGTVANLFNGYSDIELPDKVKACTEDLWVIHNLRFDTPDVYTSKIPTALRYPDLKDTHISTISTSLRYPYPQNDGRQT